MHRHAKVAHFCRWVFFEASERWADDDGTLFEPGQLCLSGRQFQMYGTALIRFRAQDFYANIMAVCPRPGR